MKSNPNRFWFIVILLGWSFDFLFWRKPAGINFLLFVFLCLASGIYLLKGDGLRLSRRSSLLLAPVIFLAAMTFLRLEPMTVFLSIAMTLFLMGVFSMTYLGGHWTRFGFIDYTIGYLALFGSMIARPLGFVAEVRRDQPSLGEKRSSSIWPILRGVVIALPVIAIFASLLSSADPIFADRLKTILDLFNIDNLPEYIFRLAYILVFAYAFAGTILHAAQKSEDTTDEKRLFAPFLGFTESVIVLGSVVILFTAFVAIQFQYFFGGHANINLEGYTFSEYARRGFGELVAVAFFSLLLLLGLGAITRRESDMQRRIFSGIGAGLVLLEIVILVSAFQRLVLYEIAYGFSRLRTYTHVFMIWLALLLVAVVVLEVFRREHRIGFAMLLVSIGFIVSLDLLNVDAFIVRQNIQREFHGAAGQVFTQGRVDLDAQYFLGLSDDAVPALVDGFQNKTLPIPVREKVGAVLMCKQDVRDQDSREFPWQSFHLSRLTADRLFAEIKKDLDAYKIINTDYPLMVQTPGGDEISCSQFYSD
ncbi:MAG TPA: DUF4153 domain-containing protein [Anaerolineales bacterium]|nr:DUF4153 domain-containing protein [Anaerolineales bacterium]